jgi:hypothetical protein
MFKKIAVLAGVFALVTVFAIPLQASLNADKMRPDMAGFGVRGGSVPAVGFDYEGDLLPSHNEEYDIGEATRTWKKIYVESVRITSGLPVCDLWVKLSSGQLNGLNSLGLGITPLLHHPTAFVDANIGDSSGSARNITLFFGSGTFAGATPTPGIGVTTTTLIGSATFYGWDSRGQYRWEHINFSTNIPNVSTRTVDNSSDIVRYVGIGNVAWAHISSFTVEITSATDTYLVQGSTPVIGIGWGQKVGLSNNIESEDQIYKVTEEGGIDTTDNSVSDGWSINSQYDWIKFDTLPNNEDNKKVCYTTFGP